MEKKNLSNENYLYALYGRNIKRNDKYLIKTLEDLKGRAWAYGCHLEIIKIPKNVKWEIVKKQGCDTMDEGMEYVSEKCRKWFAY